ncbi:MAG: hypothetical protein CVU56_23835 [Deltaproteobacteria bacterium HGW-Deltaproteobacteria-14]|nr:MAG: hypothetical protein CVU56_23835 [Deltaproteobacteria bacterium HGW-Deltaproteobacteria-14]
MSSLFVLSSPAVAQQTGSVVWPTGQSGHSTTRLPDDRFVFVGGLDVVGAPTADVVVYEFATDQFTVVAGLGAPLVYHTATLLSDGRLLIAGGNDGVSDVATLQIFDPFVNAVTASAAELESPRSGHSAISLPDGRVLFRGGYVAGLADEVYDPVTDTVSASSVAAAALPWVVTDLADYHPGETVTVTGGGWEPGEFVTLVFDEDPLQHVPYVRTLVADADGALFDDTYVIEDSDLGTAFRLGARGESSGWSAETWFTDSGNVTLLVSGIPQTDSYGFDCAITVLTGPSCTPPTAPGTQKCSAWSAVGAYNVSTLSRLLAPQTIAFGGQSYTLSTFKKADGTLFAATAAAVGGKLVGYACVPAPVNYANDGYFAFYTAGGAAAQCSIVGQTYANGVSNPDNACQKCDTSASTTAWTNKGSGTACNDGDACTQVDTCDGSGGCNGANPIVCAATSCQYPGTCNTGTGQCSNPTNKGSGEACSDGDACTQTDACDGSGSCVGSNPVTCAASDPCHDAGTCNTTTGVCSNPNKSSGAPCDDEDACTQTDACNGNGSCVGSNPVVCTAGECQVAGTCDTLSGQCSSPTNKSAGAACGSSDNTSCDAPDTCDGAGSCQEHFKLAGAPCSTGSTNQACDAQDTCLGGANVCVDRWKAADYECRGSQGVCDRGALCSGTAGGSCPSNTFEPQGTVCGSNSNPCIKEICTGSSPQCYSADRNGQTCPDFDGDLCTVAKCEGSTCMERPSYVAQAGTVCREAVSECDVTEVCTGSSVCPADLRKPAGAACGDPTPSDAVCDAADSCDGAGACRDNNVAGDCGTVGTACANQDTCVAGHCVDNGSQPSGTPCDDGSDGTYGDACDGAGDCGGTTVICAADTPCTTYAANGSATCTATQSTDPCSDDDLTTYADTCDGAGACVGTPVVCPADTPCTTYAANGSATCTAAQSTAPCSDDDLTTYADTCDGAGACVGTTVTCDEDTQCTTYTPNGSATCTATQSTDPCSDDDLTTYDDTCDGVGACVGTPVVCAADTQCATYAANGSATCAATQSTDPCSDDDLTTYDDSCDGAGACVGAPVVCPADTQCTTYAANGSATCTAAQLTVPCSDGDLTTYADTCDGAGGCVGTAVVCDPDTQCTTYAPNGTAYCAVSESTGGCDDGSLETYDDLCDGAGACFGSPVSCEQDTECATYTANGTSVCTATFDVGAPCGDSADTCLKQDTCDAAGLCVDGGHWADVAPVIVCPAAVTVWVGSVPPADFAGGSVSDNCDAYLDVSGETLAGTPIVTPPPTCSGDDNDHGRRHVRYHDARTNQYRRDEASCRRDKGGHGDWESSGHGHDWSPSGVPCSETITRTYSVTDSDNNTASCQQIITVRRLFAPDAIIWHAPLAVSRPDDTDPSDNWTRKIQFNKNSTIPVQIHVAGCDGDPTTNPSVIGRLVVYADANCDHIAGAADVVDIDGPGDDGGLMIRVGDKLKYNVNTKKLPTVQGCYILEVTVQNVSTGEEASESVWLKAK